MCEDAGPLSLWAFLERRQQTFSLHLLSGCRTLLHKGLNLAFTAVPDNVPPSGPFA